MLKWLKRKNADKSSQPKGSVVQERNFDTKAAIRVLDMIKMEFGLDYERQKSITLRKIERFALKRDIHSFEELAISLQSSGSLKTELINMLTVGETYFYREFEQIELIGDEIISGKCESVLSAPCSTGEEVYSILLYIKSRDRLPPSLRITGIDINTDALTSAKKGCFSQRSVSQLPPDITKEWFASSGERYCIDSSLKKHTDFLYANIFDRDFQRLGKFDAVLSRNMMIYFTDEEKKRALRQLSSVMHPGSILLLGHADISFVPDGFEKIRRRRAVYFKKI